MNALFILVINTSLEATVSYLSVIASSSQSLPNIKKMNSPFFQLAISNVYPNTEEYRTALQTTAYKCFKISDNERDES